MQTECNADLFSFVRVEGRAVVAVFDGGKITSDAGAPLLGATDRAIRLIDRFAGCFSDSRTPELIEHEVATLVGQRIFGIALGYEDLHRPRGAAPRSDNGGAGGKLAARRQKCAPLTGKPAAILLIPGD